MKKSLKFVYTISSVIIVFLIGLLLMTLTKGYQYNNTGVLENWYYIQDEQRIDVSLPAIVHYDGDLVLYNDSLSEEDMYKMISTRMVKYDPTIIQEDRVLYSYTENGFKRNNQMKSKLDCDAILIQDSPISIHLKNNENGTYKLNPVIIGNQSDILDIHFNNAIPLFLLCIIMITFALLCIAGFYYLKLNLKREYRLIDIAAFLFFIAIWSVFDSTYVQESSIAAFAGVISFYAFILFSIPILLYIKHITDEYKVIDAWIILHFMNAIFQGILTYLGIFHMIDMLFITHILILGSVASIIYILVKERKDPRIQELSQSFVILASCGVLALIGYWLFEISYYGLIFQIGVIIFGLSLLKSTIDIIVEAQKALLESQFYKGLAYEDRLTGLSNRLTFDEDLEILHKNVHKYQNVLLIFADVNELKYVNDNYGHGAGDEIIISAARCLESAYGDCGKLYRIGGDEFCVLIENPTKDSSYYKEKLVDAIQIRNQSEKYPLVIATGFSFLKDQNGDVRSFSEWKYEADVKMYKDKEALKL